MLNSFIIHLIIDVIISNILGYSSFSILVGMRDGEKLETFEDFLNILKTGWKREL